MAIALASGWLFSTRVTYSWNERQKRREFQLSALQQFYAAYGEFFAVWKLWDALLKVPPAPAELRWELHKRAAAAEGIIEATLVKLSCEMKLDGPDIENLGRFRQGFQQLREAIRGGGGVPWKSSETPEYRCFKRLSIQVASLLAGKWKGNYPPEKAAAQLAEITSNRFEGTWAGTN